MKIVQAVGWYYPESWGGTEIYVAGLASRLRHAGHEVLVAAPDATTRHERRYDHEGVPVYRYPIPAEPTRDEAQGAVIVRGAERFSAWLSATKPDVVHFHTFVTGLGVLEVEAAAASGARVFVTTHSASLGYLCARGTLMRFGTEPCDGHAEEEKCASCMLEHRGLPQPLARAAGAVHGAAARVASTLPGRAGAAFAMRGFIRDQQERQRRTIEAADRFVVLTQWASDAVVANGAPRAKVAVSRLGLAHVKAPAKPGPQERPTARPVTFGYLGRLDPIKGLEDLVRALTSLPRTLPFRALIHGPVFGAADRTFADRLTAMIGDDSRVRLEAAVPHAGVPRVLAGFDVLCCPSLVVEGGPTVAIEAHAVGTPVIGSNLAGLNELVTDGVNGALVAPGDRRALADLCASIATDPSLVDRWRARLPVARTLDDVARDYLAWYAA